MNEARRLEPAVLPTEAAPGATPEAPQVGLGTPVHVTATLAVSPRDDAAAAPASLPKKSLMEAPRTRAAERVESTSRSLLILFVIGFIAFVAGAGLASAMLFGWLDLEWVKDALKPVKELVRTLMSSGH
jgi:hypothetical protein